MFPIALALPTLVDPDVRFAFRTVADATLPNTKAALQANLSQSTKLLETVTLPPTNLIEARTAGGCAELCRATFLSKRHSLQESEFTSKLELCLNTFP
jgi:hypothetical protein